ncbi:MAG TPA: hypothetical protein VGK90_05605 [Rhizomicrobium sp.]|jgi:TPR repeat protein
MKHILAVALLSCCAGVASAQTTLRLQAVAKDDPCASSETEDLGSCGIEALGDANYAAARHAWLRASQRGDYQAALWLGEMYAGGKGVKKDYLQAYVWFDIAAALHARAIAREQPSGDPEWRDSNQGEIDHRNVAAKKMKLAQIKQAQQLSRNWQKSNPNAIDTDVTLAN